uniref:Uncharacterized protein n=1 Tax=Rhizophora mucronata TaxID=61149 RepID=A0A2P2JIY8_RHIMU
MLLWPLILQFLHSFTWGCSFPHIFRLLLVVAPIIVI